MATIIKPPGEIISNGKPTIFLAGSIEMGQAGNWQVEVEDAFQQTEIVILNPRRDDWDASWQQDISNARFREQVEWELAGQEQADIIAMYFEPATKSPITLLELGLFARSNKLIVCCPPGFWRKGNVDIVCAKYQIRQADSLSELIGQLKQRVAQY
jgi:hypothetical protein